MPISLIPKRKKREGFALDVNLIKENKIVVLAVIPLLIVFLIYGGISIYIGYLKGNIEDIKNKAEEIQAQRDTEAEKDVVELDFKLARLSSLLDGHIYSYKLFDFIEENIHPKAQLIDFSFEVAESLVSMKGLTTSYVTFAEQVIALKQKDQISDVVISEVDIIKSGQISFGVSFKVDQSLYK